MGDGEGGGVWLIEMGAGEAFSRSDLSEQFNYLRDVLDFDSIRVDERM